MKLENLLYGVDIQKTNVDLNTEIKEIKIDSRKVEEGDLFVCLEGVNDDGNNHIGEIDCAFVALTEKEPKNAKFVLVKDARKAYAQVCENRFLRPLEGMKFVAVVGTNGKTSTAHYIDSILSFAGVKTGLIGTEGH